MGRKCGLGTANRSHLVNFDGREETVAAAGNSFYKAWTFGGVAPGLGGFCECLVEPVVEVNECVCGPKHFLQLLASHHLARVREEHGQYLEGLFLEPDSQVVLS